MTALYRSSLQTPVGELVFAVDEAGALVAVAFPGQEDLARLAGLASSDGGRLMADETRTSAARDQLAGYFSGARRVFDLAVAPRVGTPFQRRVWQALMRIPHGITWSYARLAAETGSVARAVGSANGANPVSIVVPCHRVIGSDGSLTGYAGGLERKRWLLAHEGASLV
jgi:methylated-DNA-[protein]-cysteine S-methyltransferase